MLVSLNYIGETLVVTICVAILGVLFVACFSLILPAAACNAYERLFGAKASC